MYYYEARRVGGRVVKAYVGTGRVAELCAEYDRVERDKWRLARAGDGLAAARRAAADRVLGGWLAAAGFHRPYRGPWRRRRAFTAEAPMELVPRRPFDAWTHGDRAVAGGSAPAGPERAAGKAKAADLEAHLARRTIERLAEKASGDDAPVAAAIVHKADALRRALAGDAPNAVEVLLAERAAICWAVTHQYELAYISRMDQRLVFKEHESHDRRITAANKRFLAAPRTLATVRRLRLPDLLAVVKVCAPAG